MLKETETEEAIFFFETFLSLVAFQLGVGPDPWHCGDFCSIFCGGENQIKVLSSELGASGTVPCGKSGPGYCITFMQRLDEDLR